MKNLDHRRAVDILDRAVEFGEPPAALRAMQYRQQAIPPHIVTHRAGLASVATEPNRLFRVVFRSWKGKPRSTALKPLGAGFWGLDVTGGGDGLWIGA